MPDDQEDQKKSNSGRVLAAAIAAGVAVAVPIAAKWEGYAPKTYKDPAGIPTWCFGETEKLKKDPSYIYSKSECMGLLRDRMKADYAPRIAACIPEVAQGDRPNEFGALIDASYNAGWAGVCKSPMKTDIRTGNWVTACNRLPSWYVTAQRRVNGKRVGKPFLLKGLVSRRNDEKKVCLTGRL